MSFYSSAFIWIWEGKAYFYKKIRPRSTRESKGGLELGPVFSLREKWRVFISKNWEVLQSPILPDASLGKGGTYKDP